MRTLRSSGTVLLLVGLSLVAPLPVKASPCPGYYCPSYTFNIGTAEESRWPAEPDRTIRIEYWVNPNGQAWLPSDKVAGAAKAAAATWMRANPRLRMIYKGLSSDLPLPFDGKLVIGWWPNHGAAAAFGRPDGLNWHPQIRKELDPVWYSTPLEGNFNYDIWISPHNPIEWEPCSTSCRPYPTRYVVARDVGDGTNCPCYEPRVVPYAELQAMLTHEFGHVLGLGHVGIENCPLTMVSAGCPDWPPPSPGYRNHNAASLALGDMLGLKALYPFTCPKVKRGQRMPTRFAQVCPTIKVYTP